MSLFEELKRRRVFRVTGAYVLAAWVALQVADTLFPALHLPPWTVTLVAVLVIAGFPIALLLGWAFDLTPGGIERTAGSLRFPMRAAALATLAVAVGVSGFVLVRRRGVAARLDTNAVVVLPFRVAGDGSLAAMREGMVDLLAAKLTGEGGPRAIDSRTTLSAWRRKVSNERDDIVLAAAVQLARSLGAGQVLLGEVVGTPGRVSINAALHSAIDGRKLTTADATAPPDSMLQLVDHIVAKLLSQQAGQGARVEALLSESLTAVRAYLDGQRLYRRGDYDRAAQHFNAALREDSTFALAALGLTLAREWSRNEPDHARGSRIAWTYRHRLPQPDREYVLAFLGEQFPLPASPQDRVRAFEDILKRAPERAEAWYELGDEYFHSGARLGIEQPFDRAMAAWQRALALDSSFMPALEHQFDVFIDRRDTASVRRLVDLVYTRVQPERKYVSDAAWGAALLLRDESWLAELRARIDSISTDDAENSHEYIVMRGLPQDDVKRLGATAIRRAETSEKKDAAIVRAAVSLLNLGQPNAAREVLAQLRESSSDLHDGWVLALATMYPELETPTLAATAERMLRGPSLQAQCFAQYYRSSQGDRRDAAGTVARLRAAAAARPKEILSTGRSRVERTTETMAVCVAALEAGTKVHARTADARAAVAFLDSLLVRAPIETTWAAAFAVFSTRYHLQLGDPDNALKASRWGGPAGWAFSTLLLERARAAAQVGRREEAISAYERYLAIRAHAEPGPAVETVHQARRELAALIAEPRQL